MIASLREGSGASGDAAGVSNLEYDTVKQERDMFKEEIQQSRMTVENLRLELSVSLLPVVVTYYCITLVVGFFLPTGHVCKVFVLYTILYKK